MSHLFMSLPPSALGKPACRLGLAGRIDSELTPDDPPGFIVPQAPEWYRFMFHSPSVAVTLSAPATRAELDDDLRVLDAPPLRPAEYERLAEHGQRVRRHAGGFP